MRESRRAPRVEIKISLISKSDLEVNESKTLPKNKVVRAVTRDISTLGVGIYSSHFFPERLRVILEIDGQTFGLARPMVIKGEVRYCIHVQEVLYKCGIKFLQLSEEYRKKIEELLSTAS